MAVSLTRVLVFLIGFLPFVSLAPVPRAPFYSRDAWQAGPPASSACSNFSTNGFKAPQFITIHHTAMAFPSDLAESLKMVKSIQKFHQGPERGWCDIGYQLLVDSFGNIFQGREFILPSKWPVPHFQAGAHVGNHNSENIGISILGDFTNKTITRGTPLWGLLVDLIAYFSDMYKIEIIPSNVKGHRDWSGAQTDCPGRVENSLSELMLDAQKIRYGTCKVSMNGQTLYGNCIDETNCQAPYKTQTGLCPGSNRIKCCYNPNA
eukprot:TRINITY_DN3579_c0_g1_i1.p1 TRINITY_DN3579_c0_g1~~TRINITY_DN3579_c0_g1_i1.p1  ORF type:complete len:301 (-),score=36.11 TRINITY_DN3579_c0_g1_i1:90-878(-)